MRFSIGHFLKMLGRRDHKSTKEHVNLRAGVHPAYVRLHVPQFNISNHTKKIGLIHSDSEFPHLVKYIWVVRIIHLFHLPEYGECLTDKTADKHRDEPLNKKIVMRNS